jgi:hypothetical protein
MLDVIEGAIQQAPQPTRQVTSSSVRAVGSESSGSAIRDAYYSTYSAGYAAAPRVLPANDGKGDTAWSSAMEYTVHNGHTHLTAHLTFYERIRRKRRRLRRSIRGIQEAL